MTKKKPIKSKLPKYITEGVIITLVPIIGYSLKFIYEYAYGRYFAIPPELISFSLSSIFPTLFIVILFISFVIYQVGTVFHYSDKKMNFIQIVFRNISILVILSPITYIISPDKLYYLLFLAPASFLILRHFVLPLVWHNKTKGYINKTNEHFNKAATSSDTVIDKLFNFGMYQISTIPILSIGLFIMTGIYGYQCAQKQETFWVDSKDSTAVVVRFIDDKAIFIRIIGGKMTGDFWVKGLSESNLILNKKHIGNINK